jgi:transcriptional regulator with XRE-family HTH domain
LHHNLATTEKAENARIARGQRLLASGDGLLLGLQPDRRQFQLFAVSQGDIEKRTGLLRYSTSRVENGRVVPSVETLEKYAAALEIPMYRLFYEGDKPGRSPIFLPPK